jgi:hypothetical protein
MTVLNGQASLTELTLAGNNGGQKEHRRAAIREDFDGTRLTETSISAKQRSPQNRPPPQPGKHPFRAAI